MSDYVVATTRDVAIKVNGSKLAMVQEYKTASYKIDGNFYNLIEIDRLLNPPGLSDGIDFFALSNFKLTFTYPDGEVAYGGCNWQEIHEYCDQQGQIHQRAVIKAFGRIRE